jgi:hypothetical protein
VTAVTAGGMRRGLVAGLLATVVATGGLVLREATMTTPHRLVPGTATRIVFDVEHRRRQATADDVRTLWALCREPLTDTQKAAALETTGPARGAVVVAPGLGPHQQRRVRGCLEDLTLDRRVGRVVALAPTRPLD